MCGRYLLTSPKEALVKAFKVNAEANIPPRYNIGPSQPVLIVRKSPGGKNELAAVEWGLVPEWKKERGDKPLINARVETVVEKPSFRSSIKRTRCLVPFDGWYEWKSEAGRRQPYWVRPVGGSVHAFAGVWATWHGPTGDHWLETMAILTAPTKGPMRHLHNRLPLVVPPDQYEDWLTPHDPLPRGFLDGFSFVPETRFEWDQVNMYVNNVRNEGPDCISPPDHERQQSLF